MEGTGTQNSRPADSQILTDGGLTGEDATRGVYAAAYETYHDLGWSPIKLKAATKWPPPVGFTGHDGAVPSYADMHAWAEDEPDGNLALRMADDMIGLDVDDYDGKTGGDTIAELEQRLGPLPYSPRSSSRPDDPVSGIRPFRVPAGTTLITALPGVEVVQRHHRYIVCWPSVHPQGRVYRWYGIDGGELAAPPAPGDIPDLPDAWLDYLRCPEPASVLTGERADVEECLTDGDPSPKVAQRLSAALAALAAGSSRHDDTRDHVLALLRYGRQKEPGVKAAVLTLGQAFIAAVGPDRDGGADEARDEYRRMVYGDRAAALLAEPGYNDWFDDIGKADEDAFWDSRGSLQCIRDTARACLVSPWGLLGVCLVYALDTLPYHVHLPGIGDDDSPGSLSLFVALASKSGDNKGRTVRVARRLMGRTQADLSPGSGEGLIKCFVRRAKDDDDGDFFEVGADKFRWVAHTVVFNVPEVDTLVALAQRSSATLPSLLRSAFSGEQLGFQYAEDAKRLYVPADQYRFGMVVGVQPGNAGPLFADTSGGTPQRFAWLPSTDPTIRRDNRPDKPEPLKLTEFDCWRSLSVFELCEGARDDIEDAAVARARGEVAALDGHALFVRAKIAVALAVLDNRVAVSDEDWRLAGAVMDMSDRTRSSVQTALRGASTDAAVEAGKVAGLKASVAADVEHDHHLERVVNVLVRAAGRRGPMKPRELRRSVAGRDKPMASVAYDLAVERGLLIESDGLVSASG